MEDKSYQVDLDVTAIDRQLTIETINRLSLDPVWTGILLDRAREGESDIRLAVMYFARTMQPSRYLEIGVRRGHSAAMVACAAAHCHLYLADSWLPNYGAVDNPGPEFVQAEIEKLGFKGQMTFLTGASAITVPQYFEQNAVALDLILVDGGHTYHECLTDLQNCGLIARLLTVILVDDLNEREVYRAWCDAQEPLGDDFSFMRWGDVGIIRREKV